MFVCASARTMLRSLSSPTYHSYSARSANCGRPSERSLLQASRPGWPGKTGLLPGWPGKTVLAELRAFGDLKEWRGANRSGTHSLRTGPARAILDAGAFFFPAPSFGAMALIRLPAFSWTWDMGHPGLGACGVRSFGFDYGRDRYPSSKPPRYKDPKDCRSLA